jgi:zinc transport system substrate-binding protein
LDIDFQTNLAACTNRKFITSHDAFGYLAERYKLEQLSIAGISPESEPSPRHLAELTALIKKEHIPYVFFETLVSPKFAQTLAQETGARTLTLNPLEGLTLEDKKHGADYMSIMKENLSHLKTALVCK